MLKGGNACFTDQSRTLCRGHESLTAGVHSTPLKRMPVSILTKQAVALSVALEVVFATERFGTLRAPEWLVASVTALVVKSIRRVLGAVAAEPALVPLRPSCRSTGLRCILPQVWWSKNLHA